MKLLILGGAGFIGANLACNFAKDGWLVDVVDNLVRRGSEFNLPRLKEHGVNFIHGDIRNKEDFDNLSNDYHAILLTAAQPSAVNYKNPAFDIQNNTVGVLNTLEYSRKTRIPIVFWSTNKVYPGIGCNHFAYVEKPTRYEWVDIVPRQRKGLIGQQNLTPEQAVMVALHERDGFTERGITTKFNLNGGDRSIYGVSKAMADLLIQEWSDAYGIPAVINRFSCLAGPYQWGKSEQGWVAWFVIANLLKLPVTIYGWGGKQVRDCLFMDDIQELVLKQIQYLHNGGPSTVVNVGGGKDNTLSVLELINMVEEKTGDKFVSIDKNGPLRRADQRIYISDLDKVKTMFEWSPKVDVSTGIDQILDWARNNLDTIKSLYLEQ